MEEAKKVSSLENSQTENSQNQTIKDFSAHHRQKAFRIVMLSLITLIFALGFTYYQNVKLESQNSRLRQDFGGRAKLTPTPTINPTANWKTYTNNEFGFTLKYPANWVVGDFSAEPDPKIYFAPTKTNITFNPFGNTTKLVVAPHGFGSEPPSGRILSDGTPFAKFLTIKTIPPSWRKVGFVYGSVEVKNLSTTCERNGEIVKSGCDIFGGERLIYHGSVDTSTWRIIDQILSTFKFLN
ncbi:MAG: hypothetical protein A2857_06980 [Candidatus Levybacteria bacterium RIFCSPHIGHO2_01_FULL_36_15]|nr:MAG: hypothetical protein A2857_06980 [Candidatus Levybacteria bacterium RIFCSPHIGHO2_01_FULL_36_15]OGH37319.1 MAG: hypothetical protein A2905_03640 [Candidatus Levybacteria bacterium RIFCSPLOWO2_01_FULL_36_10]